MGRGQVSMFIIIGLMILAAVILSFIVKERQPTFVESAAERLGTEVPQKAIPLKTFIEQCMAKEGDAAIRLLALQGGRINFSSISPEQYLATYANISYALDRGSVTLVSISTMEQELADELEQRIPRCIGDLGPFRQNWQQLYADPLTVNATIREDRVVLRVHYPLTLVDNQGTTRIADFSTGVPLRVGYLHALLWNITREFSRNPEWIDTTLLSDLSRQVRINVLSEDAERYVLSLTDNRSTPPLVLLAAVRVPANAVPRLVNLRDAYTMPRGQRFALQVEARDDRSVRFSDDTTLFDINPSTGIIQFTPRTVGVRQVRITATDVEGKYDDQTVTFTVGGP